VRTSILVDGVVYGFQRFGGINTYFNEVMARLAKRPDTRVEVLVPRVCSGRLPSWPVLKLRRELFPVEGLGINGRVSQRVRPLLKMLNTTVTVLRARVRQPCVFHSTYFTWLPNGVPQVASAYDMNHELFPQMYASDWGQWLRWQYREYLTRAARVIAISERTKRDIVRIYGLDPSVIDVVHLAIDRERFRPECDARQRDYLREKAGLASPYLLYVGLRNDYKNFDGLLRALADSPLRERLTLAVAGRPWQEEELALVRRVGLEGRVRLIVNPSDEVLRALYSFAAAFVYPSRHEGFGIPLLEAMACGCPVLASDTEVFHEVAGDAVIYFSPDDPADIGRTFEAALDEPTREVFRERGFARIERYSWERCAEQTFEVYQKALAGHSVTQRANGRG
jgi:glycosyltransferase involved in cell wall biosynthesis